MSVLDFFLNCAALLLWLNWWSRGVSPLRANGIALVRTLRRAEPARRDRWTSPAVLVSMLLIRAILYWQIGSATHWMPRLSLVAIKVPFRSDSLGRMLLFSFFSFVVFGGAFYFCALLISALNHKAPATNSWQAFFRVLLGPIDRLPRGIKFLLPFLIGAVFWIVVGPLLSFAGVQAPVNSFTHRIQEAVLIGIGAWLAWKYVIAFVLVLHIVTSYVYFGPAPMWQFVSNTARQLLRPLAVVPLRIGRFDFAPILALAIVFTVAEFLNRALPKLYARLP
ncbi:MAG TPA: hypothetical protein VK530_15620, partial [Candidatus Acidoferrum sp.]|nr:hypothetical protein [Candidatus Acidoferrum sp.]